MINSKQLNLRVAAYARYSTDRQTDNSIAYQMDKINEYCAKNSMEIVARFKDEAESGTSVENRAEFLDMVSLAKRGAFNAIVVYDITRGSRDVGDWFAFRKTMRQFNVSVISVEDNLGDIFNPNDFLTELISVGLGQHHVLSTRQKSKDGVAVKAKQGVFLGGYPPLGYDIINGHYIINEKEAKSVITIFEMYANGCSYNNILDALSGIRGKRGKLLGKNSIPSILRNERYIGVYTWNKKTMKIMGKWAGGKPNPDAVRIEDIIPPIISNELWERVKKRMENTSKASNKAKRTYLLSGLIECSSCGSTYVGHCSTNKKGYSTRYYICGNKYRTRSCSAKNINADEIETFVVQQLKSYLSNVDFSEIAQTIADKVNNATPNLSKEKKELEEINKQIYNGMKAVLKGIEFPELEEEISHLRVRKSELEDIINRNTNLNKKIDPNKIVDLFKYSIENLENNLPEIIKYHITKIYANLDGSFTVNVGVHIDGCGGRI